MLMLHVGDVPVVALRLWCVSGVAARTCIKPYRPASAYGWWSEVQFIVLW
jgi:hypothetical protein